MSHHYLSVERTREELHLGCYGKVAYPSRRQGKGVLRVMRQHGRAGETLGIYKCRWCRHWHLGNSRHNRES